MQTILTAAVPLLFQAISASLCAVNYVNPPNVCYSMTDSPIAPGKVDMQFLDINAGQYLDFHWITPDTSISIFRDQNGCYEWLNDDWNTTTTCI